MSTSKVSLITMVFLLLTCSFSVMGCADKYQQESTGQYVDSSVVTAKVKAKLMADDAVPGAAISVVTYKNVVQLSGFVNNQAQKERAVRLAKQVPGVVQVKDALEIKH